MNIQLTPSFAAKVEIKDLNGAVLYQQNFNSDQNLKDFIVIYGKSKPGWSLLEGLVSPLRMDSWQHFAEDFFLPTFVHYALKVNHIALKVIASIFAIALDVITLPIRFITTPFYAYANYNYLEPAHLIEHDLGVAGHDVVNLCYEKQETIVGAPAGGLPQNGSESTYAGIKKVALKNLAGGVSEHPVEIENITSYVNINGQWNRTKKIIDIAEKSLFV